MAPAAPLTGRASFEPQLETRPDNSHEFQTGSQNRELFGRNRRNTSGPSPTLPASMNPTGAFSVPSTLELSGRPKKGSATKASRGQSAGAFRLVVPGWFIQFETKPQESPTRRAL
jgi:hypothetical protein